MSTQQGSGGISQINCVIPPPGQKTNGAKPSQNKYKNHVPSEQKYSAGQRRVARKGTK